ncbi:hypothetical protein C0995_006068 [Termitomyces sp. Mi166|nr:hypothetical protein C0995_006068 [Termitomyces sp. Mi166\
MVHCGRITSLLIDPKRPSRHLMPFTESEIEEVYQKALRSGVSLYRDAFFGKYLPHELFWVGLQPFLLTLGYQLRQRYQPGWIPSWFRGKEIDVEYLLYEDSIVPSKPNIMDATRMHDGLKVALKCLDTNSDEISIALYLCSANVGTDPRNHTMPVLDVILLPPDGSKSLIVMPQLFPFDELPFRRFGELAEAFRQYIEVWGSESFRIDSPFLNNKLQGLDFMHQHGIVHGDACCLNLVMDMSQVVPRGVHMFAPDTHDGVTSGLDWNERSTVGPIKYYFIDFGLSVKLNQPEVWGGHYGQDPSVPEFQIPNLRFDPFKVDIYQLGNVLMRMTKDYDGVGLLKKLGKMMTRKNPDRRIGLQSALEWLDRVPEETLNQPIWLKSVSKSSR